MFTRSKAKPINVPLDLLILLKVHSQISENFIFEINLFVVVFLSIAEEKNERKNTK